MTLFTQIHVYRHHFFFPQRVHNGAWKKILCNWSAIKKYASLKELNLCREQPDVTYSSISNTITLVIWVSFFFSFFLVFFAKLLRVISSFHHRINSRSGYMLKIKTKMVEKCISFYMSTQEGKNGVNTKQEHNTAF